MPINGVPSDDWRIKRALGPYAEPMDEDGFNIYQEHIKKQSKDTYNDRTDRESDDFKIPF